VLDLRPGGSLDVDRKRVEGAVAVPFQPDQIRLTAEQPAGERRFEKGLGEDDGLTGEEGAGEVDNAGVVDGAALGWVVVAQVDEPEPLPICSIVSYSNSLPERVREGGISCAWIPPRRRNPVPARRW
jgi:hypothetical protein